MLRRCVIDESETGETVVRYFVREDDNKSWSEVENKVDWIESFNPGFILKAYYRGFQTDLKELRKLKKEKEKQNG